MNVCPICKSNVKMVSQFKFCENPNCDFMTNDSNTPDDENEDINKTSEHEEPEKDIDVVKKRYSIYESVEEYFSKYIYKNKEIKILNWFLAPYSMKSHSKIARAILLFLDSFGLTYDELIKARKEYYKIQSLGNFKINFSRVYQLYDLLNCIYDITPVIKSNELFGKNVDERIIMLLERVFNSNNAEKIHYSSEIKCNICGFTKLNYHENFVIKVNGCLSKLSNTEIHIDIDCPNCERKTAKEIISNLIILKYLMFHFPSGVNKKLLEKLMNFKPTNLESESIEVIGLVECLNKVVLNPATEKKMDRVSYLSSRKPREDHLNGCILHIHNINGWYSLNENRILMVPPTDCPVIRSPSNLSIFVMGALANPSDCKEKFNVIEFIKDSRAQMKQDIVSYISSAQITEDSSENRLQVEDSHKIISKIDDEKCVKVTKDSHEKKFVQFKGKSKKCYKNSILKSKTSIEKRNKISGKQKVSEAIKLMDKVKPVKILFDPKEPGDINDLISKKQKCFKK